MVKTSLAQNFIDVMVHGSLATHPLLWTSSLSSISDDGIAV